MAEAIYSLLLKGGHVIDPASGLSAVADVAIRDGKIAQVAPDIDPGTAKKVISAEGLLVTPGLVDMHCHFYPTFPAGEDTLPCIHPDAHLPQQGVTTAVDAGTCGCRDFVRFKEDVIDRSPLRLLAFINIADGGMVSMQSEQNLGEFRPQAVAGLAAAFPDTVVGVKTAHYWVGKPFTAEHPAWASVDRTLEAARLAHLPAMFDFQPTLPERSYPQLLEKLAPGDIHTHVYAQQFPILDAQGKVNPFLFAARDRGVLFDLGHGAGSFWLRNAVPAYRQGFYPDTLSTDQYAKNIAGPVFGLTRVMAKYLNIGMPLEEVIFRTTLRPAQILHHPEIGTLQPGACADVAVLKISEGDFAFADAGQARLRGHRNLTCEMTIRAGKVLYDLNARSLPDWETAPAEYWVSPGVIREP